MSVPARLSPSLPLSLLSPLAATSLALSMLPFLAGCALWAPYQEPYAVEPIEVSEGEEVAVDRLIVLFDASGSIDARSEFPSEKAWVESFVQGMPEGDYAATIRSFGGDRRRGPGLSPFVRQQLAESAHELRAIGDDSPLDAALREIGDEIAGTAGRTAVVVVSDGRPNPPRWGEPAQPALAAARSVAEQTDGTVCFHTVLAGDDDAGRPLLESIAGITPCGSFRASTTLAERGELVAFERSVFVTERAPLPAVAAPAPPDLDGDGVRNAADACPDTPKGAEIDDRGCWVLEGVRFASGSAEMLAGGGAAVASVAAVLEQNPDLRIRIEGHTDATGPERYNEWLSGQRAEQVKAALVADGVDADRLETAGLGSRNPAADNATPEGRAHNRRIEFTVLR